MASENTPKNVGKVSSNAQSKGTHKSQSGEMANASKPFNMNARKKKARQAFDNAKYRCKTNPSYKGVQFLFPNFQEFLSEVGLPKTRKESVDRINPNGHYEPGNVRWISSAVQAVNKKKSTLGTMAPLYILEQHYKYQAYQSELRQKIALAWAICVSSLNRRYLTEDDVLWLRDNPVAPGILQANFDYTTPYDHWLKPVGFFHLPSLTVPGERIRLRGGPIISSADAGWDRTGTIKVLGHYRLETNLSPSQIEAVKSALDGGNNLAWIGPPNPGSGSVGGVDGAMISIASRLRDRGRSAAIYPALTIISELNQLGKYWEGGDHPIVTSEFLLIPDFQIDQGAGFELSQPQQFRLSNLLEYRLAAGLKTWVGVQNPHKLNEPARKLIFGHFKPADYSKFMEISHSATSDPPITQEVMVVPKGHYSLSCLKKFPNLNFLLKQDG